VETRYVPLTGWNPAPIISRHLRNSDKPQVHGSSPRQPGSGSCGNPSSAARAITRSSGPAAHTRAAADRGAQPGHRTAAGRGLDRGSGPQQSPAQPGHRPRRSTEAAGRYCERVAKSFAIGCARPRSLFLMHEHWPQPRWAELPPFPDWWMFLTCSRSALYAGNEDQPSFEPSSRDLDER
jgi:hypothetical protein